MRLVAEEIEAVGGSALPIVGDIRHDEQVAAAVATTVDAFGGIDICVNNASAINLSGNTILTSETCGDAAGCLDAFPFNDYFDDIYYYIKPSEAVTDDWDKQNFEGSVKTLTVATRVLRLVADLDERLALAGVATEGTHDEGGHE